MHSTTFVTLFILGAVLWSACTFSTALSCDSCGRECAAACGTRHFRTCCFNYLRKRTSIPANLEGTVLDPNAEPSPGLRLELWLAKSKASHNLHERESNIAKTELIENVIKAATTGNNINTNKNHVTRAYPHYRDIKAIEINRIDQDFDDLEIVTESPESSRLQLIYDA